MTIAEHGMVERVRDMARALAVRGRSDLANLLDWSLEVMPIAGHRARRRRARVVLEPYLRTATLRRSLLTLVLLPALAVFCLVYGFFFGLTAPWLIVPFAAPIGILGAIIIWALPDQRTAPTLGIELLYPAVFILLVLWPNYLAISLPGLPWITAVRLIGFPLVLLLLVCLSVSPGLRRRLKENFNATKPIFLCLIGFAIIQILTLPFSKAPFGSAQSVLNQNLAFTTSFIVANLLFRDIRYVERYWALLCLLSIPIVLLTSVETSRQYILWANHIPSFLHPPDPSIEVTLTPLFRPGLNLYRAKATFSTPLGLAEYLALLTPFLLHFAFWAKRLPVRVACVAMIPLIFIGIRMTDARLGVAGVFISVLGYGVFWSIQRWASRPRDLLSAAILYAYPALFAAGVGATFVSHRLNTMVFGGGAQASSSDARDIQLRMAMEKLSKQPWGFGAGQSGEALGFAEGSFITIDNFFIGVSLDYGVLGAACWYGMFVAGIIYSTRYATSPRYAGRPESRLLGAIAILLVAFLFIKWVHGQFNNHAIYMMVLGTIPPLIYRLKHGVHEASKGADGIAEAERSY